jgi:antirestriction protein
VFVGRSYAWPRSMIPMSVILEKGLAWASSWFMMFVIMGTCSAREAVIPIIVVSIVGFLLVLLVVFWGWISTNIAVIGTIATSLAFFAALWSAFEARKSAKAAFLAVKTAEASLEEARKNFRKEAFNQRFSLLLEQHNVYLEKINKFVGSDKGWALVEEIFKSKKHRVAFELLRGHFICSPYMRVLYHLLKFINDDYYGNKDDVKGRKKYSSLVRSLISNDVLFLIAVNSSFIKEGEVFNQYNNYQKYLQRFDFFEHADFSVLYQLVNTEKYIRDARGLSTVEDDIRGKLFAYAIFNKKDSLKYYTPDISLSVRLSYIYKSPNQEETEKWFDDAREFINKLIVDIKIQFSSDDEYYNSYLQYVIGKNKTENMALGNHIRELGGSDVLVKSIIDKFISCRKNGKQLPGPAFKVYSYNEQSKEFAFVSDSTHLSDRIDEYLEKLKNKNEFIDEEVYASDVFDVTTALENAKTCMHEQRHPDVSG